MIPLELPVDQTFSVKFRILCLKHYIDTSYMPINTTEEYQRMKICNADFVMAHFLKCFQLLCFEMSTYRLSDCCVVYFLTLWLLYCLLLDSLTVVLSTYWLYDCCVVYFLTLWLLCCLLLDSLTVVLSTSWLSDCCVVYFLTLWVLCCLLIDSLTLVFQFFALVLGLVYLKTNDDYDQDDIMNLNGVIFIIITNLSFNHLFSVLNVSRHTVTYVGISIVSEVMLLYYSWNFVNAAVSQYCYMSQCCYMSQLC